MSTIRNFPDFARAVHARLKTMSKGELFTVDVEDLFTTYLLAFPEGTNPIFRKQTEHDCSCCKQFIRNFGRTFAIVNNQRVTVWGDGSDLPYPYNEVAAKLNAIIQQAPIQSVFRTKEEAYGAHHTIEMLESGGTHLWHHFHGQVERQFRCDRPDEVKGELNTTAQVLHRGVTELTLQATETVIQLIEENALYRGQEHLRAVKEFYALQKAHKNAPNPELLIWESISKPVARFRNTAIGTLVQDLSDGTEVEAAVRMFESKVAPANYKRPKPVVTTKMVDSALETIRSLNLESALERRFAKISDISVTDVLFVDNAVRGKMQNGLRDVLMAAATVKSPSSSNATPIAIEAFVREVLPTAKSINLHLGNSHLGNFMSLTAPVHQDAFPLFKWTNGFAWTYDGDVTDSIKEKVKRAGGNVNAALRVSLAWSNFDDLDLHALCPDGRIYFGERKGILDVDMNGMDGRSREPVENLSWKKPKDGRYRIQVNQYKRRETIDYGFTLEIQCGGVVHQFSCKDSPPSKHTVDCLEFTLSNGVMSVPVLLTKALHGGNIPVEKWGLKTGQVVRVDSMMTSPNHWEGAGEVGAKHWLFVLEGCCNPDQARGIYNEFLRNDLQLHSKVFELLGSKTKCPHSTEQLSGVGFTAGRGDKVVVSVGTMSNTRAYEINF